MTGSDILFCETLTDAEKLVLLYIWVDCDRANDSNIYREHIPIDRLCRRTGLDHAQVTEAVQSLINKGLFYVFEEDLTGQPDDYILIDTFWSKWGLGKDGTVNTNQPAEDKKMERLKLSDKMVTVDIGKMEVTDEILARAEKLAYENYETWGNWVVECFTTEELADDLRRHKSLKAWVKHRKDLAGIYDERSQAW